MPTLQEHIEFLKHLGFTLDAADTSADGHITSYKSPDRDLHRVLRIYFTTHGYRFDDRNRSGRPRVYMRHTGNPHVNLEREPKDCTVQVSWGRRGTGVSFLMPLSCSKQST